MQLTGAITTINATATATRTTRDKEFQYDATVNEITVSLWVYNALIMSFMKMQLYK